MTQILKGPEVRSVGKVGYGRIDRIRIIRMMGRMERAGGLLNA